jgi:hypothetical protein
MVYLTNNLFMKIRLIVGSIVLLVVILINACEDKVVAPVMGLSNCDTTNLTYNSDSNTMIAIVNVQCGATSTSCHSSGSISGYDYSTYAGIYSNYQNGLLYGALFGTLPRMPLTPQAGWDPSCMLPKFKAWMNRGCPQ